LRYRSSVSELEETVPDVLIRDVDETTLNRLKERARSHGRSLGVELRLILEQVAKQVDMATARALAEQMTCSLQGRPHTDSAELLREDRSR
jgi:antitoxin FitA